MDVKAELSVRSALTPFCHDSAHMNRNTDNTQHVPPRLKLHVVENIDQDRMNHEEFLAKNQEKIYSCSNTDGKS